jgi:TPR repeat protein
MIRFTLMNNAQALLLALMMGLCVAPSLAGAAPSGPIVGEAERAALEAKARDGDASAANRLGYVLLTGRTEAGSDPVAARDWFAQAARAGLAVGQYNYGSIFFFGAGVARDPAKAAMWYAKAADQDHAPAMHMLARAHIMGLGVALDEPRSFELLARAAGLGHGPAQLDLGDYFREGIGTKRDLAQAYFWYRVAERSGLAKGAVSASNVGVELAPEARMTLDARARAWKPPTPPAGKTR